MPLLKKTLPSRLCLLLLLLFLPGSLQMPHPTTPLHTVGTTRSILPAATGAVFCSSQAEDPIDRLFFFGESTTAHLRSTGVLRGGKQTTQVLAPSSNTMLLSPKTPDLMLRDPAGGECTLREFAARERPRCIVLCFGLNGVLHFFEREDYFLSCYRTLCNAVLTASPDTHLLLQTVYPVSRAPAPWQFPVSPEEINSALVSLNRLLPVLAAEDERITAVDTASALTDREGYLPNALTTDGIHLTPDAYRIILDVLRQTLNENPGILFYKERNLL